MRLLLIEDDNLLGESVMKGLRQEGYAVDWVKSAKEARATLFVTEYKAILLDLVLPDAFGLDLLEELRGTGNKTPILVVTARDAISDRVKGLDRGADDYIIKPFDIEELFARLRSLERRLGDRAASVLTFADISLDPASHQVMKDGVSIELPQKEFMILQLLMENSGRFVSKTKIVESIYSWDEEVGSNTVEVYISALRKKFGKDKIKMLRNIGYRLENRS
ncbi:response regulator [Exilibacterium tricleocarpae]|uniref:Response regulator n=1 Tax=Exilibacterium tricleocarpae TaxID=2591008 RepID=A0A545TLR7_9GAMM|nr:response regulator [Exilibacterium tricleocarpae]TQV78172.1 response regulator [Exilibacterium tricleocarpae]